MVLYYNKIVGQKICLHVKTANFNSFDRFSSIPSKNERTTKRMLLLNFDKEYKNLKNAASEKGLYTDSLPKSYQKAKSGSAPDCYAVGMLYKQLGQPRRAFDYFFKGSLKENSDCEYEIALIIIENGPVSIEDKDGYSGVYEAPEPWLERAWVHGNAKSAYKMAEQILAGPSPDMEKAVHWMRCSFEHNEECDCLLVANYLQSTGQMSEAAIFLDAAAKSGDPDAAMRASLILTQSEEVSDRIRAYELAKAALENSLYQKSAKIYLDCAKVAERAESFEFAFECFEKALYASAVENDAESEALAAEKLGDMTYRGVGTVQNYTKAVEYFEKVKSFTTESAKSAYADCKLRGLGTDKSVEVAAELGSPEALYKLACENPDKPEYLERAAAKGHREALYELGKAQFEADEYSKAFQNLLKVSHEKSDVPYMLGVCLANMGQLRDALSYFELCASSGEGRGMYLAGKFYLEGMGCTKDEKKAVEYFKKAAAVGDIDGVFELGMCCKNGIGTAKNPSRAAALISAAAENGSAGALFEMGNIKRLEDKEAAIAYYRASAEKGYESAMYQMGFLYEVGYINGKRDIKNALEWYGKCRKSFKDVKAKISACSIELGLISKN